MAQRLIILFTCIMATALSACSPRQAANKDANTAWSGQWYHMYTGTVGNRQAVLNLHHFDGKTDGFFYYTDSGKVQEVEDDDGAEGDSIVLNVFKKTNHTTRYDNDSAIPDHWEVALKNGALTGVAVSGAQMQAIRMAEQYPAGSTPLTLYLHGDSVQDKKGFTVTKAITFYQYLLPQTDTGGFVATTELRLWGADTLGANSFQQYISKEDKKFVARFKMLLKDLNVDERPGHEDDWEYDYVHARNILALYNANNMLSVGVFDYDHSGSGSGTGVYLGNYACIDLSEHRIWKMSDIIDGESTRLQALLDKGVRDIYKLGPTENLSRTLTVSAIPITDNVFITGRGITFCYHPMMIGSEIDGEICVFIPYANIQSMLKPEFRKRMNIANTAAK